MKLEIRGPQNFMTLAFTTPLARLSAFCCCVVIAMTTRAHCKKLEVDLTQQMSSQLQSGFIQVMTNLIPFTSPCFRVTSLVQSRIPAKHTNEIHCRFVPKGGGTLTIIMYYWMNSQNIHVLWVNLWVEFLYF